MNRAYLREALAEAEGDVVAGADHIERQRLIIRRLELAGLGHSLTAETARALLISMKEGQMRHMADRDRIKQLLVRRA